MEFLEVAFAVGAVGEIFVEEGGAFGARGIFPFGLVGKENVGAFLPIALEAGSFGSGSGGGAVLVIA